MLSKIGLTGTRGKMTVNNSDSIMNYNNEAFEKDDTDLSGNNGLPRKNVCIDLSTEPQSFDHHRPAVSVKDAYKHYNTKRGANPILKGFNMTVKQGSIYSLLGSSGCGKTTLLSCIVGIKKLNSGDIFCFGSRPGTKHCGIPGKKVGYMPQDIALHDEFTIDETLKYYAQLYGMDSALAEENKTFLIAFLNLPPGHRRVSSMSGGQKRRVSFAAALIHNPELLILDEPTVGVDALLRQSIWDHLEKLVSTGKTTVIITTHYIEEARQSNKVGLMRSGRLLVEESPMRLQEIYKTPLLEDIVYQLCLKDQNDTVIESATPPEDGKQEGVSRQYRASRTSIDDGNMNWRKFHRASVVNFKETPGLTDEITESFLRIRALCLKNVLMLFRNLVFLIFMTFVPMLQMVLLGIAVGKEPKHLKLGIIDYELMNRNPMGNFSCPDLGNSTCVIDDNYVGSLGCQFVNMMQSDFEPSVEMVYYDDEQMAIEDSLASKIWGIMRFPENFTLETKNKFLYGSHAEIEAFYGSRISVTLDMSNKQIAHHLMSVIAITMQSFWSELAKSCDVDPIMTKPSIFFDEPLYGRDATSFQEYIAPGFLLGILFFFPLSSSGVSLITERKLGTLDRTMVAGVTYFEYMTSYTLTHVALLIVQSGLALVWMVTVMDMEIQGEWYLAFALALLIGISGISFGFVLAMVCSEEIEAVLMAMGLFTPNMLLGGIIWPIEAMSTAVRIASYVLPCTLACEAMRSVFERGVGITHIKVWPGFAVTVGWIAVYWILSAVIQRLKSKQ